MFLFSVRIDATFDPSMLHISDEFYQDQQFWQILACITSFYDCELQKIFLLFKEFLSTKFRSSFLISSTMHGYNIFLCDIKTCSINLHFLRKNGCPGVKKVGFSAHFCWFCETVIFKLKLLSCLLCYQFQKLLKSFWRPYLQD